MGLVQQGAQQAEEAQPQESSGHDFRTEGAGTQMVKEEEASEEPSLGGTLFMVPAKCPLPNPGRVRQIPATPAEMLGRISASFTLAGQDCAKGEGEGESVSRAQAPGKDQG